jgi:hypothetical protein
VLGGTEYKGQQDATEDQDGQEDGQGGQVHTPSLLVPVIELREHHVADNL